LYRRYPAFVETLRQMKSYQASCVVAASYFARAREANAARTERTDGR